jgi:hypothetical protein
MAGQHLQRADRTHRPPQQRSTNGTVPLQRQPTPADDELERTLTIPRDQLRPKDIIALQQTVGNQAVRRILAQRQSTSVASHPYQQVPNNYVQAKKVLTMGGEWEAKDGEYVEYNDVNGKTPIRGVDMRLNFYPNSSVNAEQIGLTQSITSLEGNRASQFDSDENKFRQKQEQQIQDGQFEGAMIDRAGTASHNNPIYGSDVNKTGELQNTSFNNQKPGFSQAGRRVPGEDPIKAVLTDTPQRPTPPPNSRQEFETTAVATKGVQQDTYYGSVQWGWETDGDGTFSMIPFDMKAFGNPTARFKASAQQWNNAHSDVKTRLNMNTFKPETVVDQNTPNVPLPVPDSPGTEALMPLPTKAEYKSMKAAATKKKTPFSGQLSTKGYGNYEKKYNNALATQNYQKARGIIDELRLDLSTMNNKGDNYWISSALKDTQFVPLYNSIRSLLKALEIKNAI